VTDITQDYATSVTKPTDPTRTGYTFAGWYSDEALDTSYTFSTMPATDTRLYAKWTVNRYTIYFEEYLGSIITDLTQDFGTAVTKPADPTRTNYTFVGWFSDVTKTSPYTFPATMPATDTTIFAKWRLADTTPPTLTVYKKGTTTPVANNSIIHGDITILIPADAVNYSAKRNGAAYAWPVGGNFTEPGTYVITTSDAVGNIGTFTFTIAKPIITAVKASTTTAVLNNGYSNKSVTVTITGYQTRSIRKDGVSIVWNSPSNTFWSDGVYIVTAVDSLGGTSTFKFTIHTILPAVTIKTTGGVVVGNGGTTYSNVTITASCPLMATKTVTVNGIKVTWPATNLFTAKGAYVVTATDLAGNVKIVKFTRK
jgi:uncharacterized repeat protein (TIGR02543 family)